MIVVNDGESVYKVTLPQWKMASMFKKNSGYEHKLWLIRKNLQLDLILALEMFKEEKEWECSS